MLFISTGHPCGGRGLMHEVTAGGRDPHLGLCWVLWARVASSSLWHQALRAPAKDRSGPEEGHPSSCLCCLSHQFGDTSLLPAGNWAETQQARAAHGPSGRCWAETGIVFFSLPALSPPQGMAGCACAQGCAEECSARGHQHHLPGSVL